MLGNRRTRDIERLTGRRRDTEQRAILWSEIEHVAQKLSKMLTTPKAAKAIADQLDSVALSDIALQRSNAIREVNQLIDSTNTFIENEAARLDASDQAIIDNEIASVEARLGDAETAVENEIIARTDGDTALGQSITTVEANLAAAEASVNENASAIATIEGYQAATYSLRVDAGDAQSSLELVAADDPINGPRSAVRIRADNILLDGSVYAHHINVGSLAADTAFITTLTAEQAFIDSIEVGEASITSANIASLDASKITTGVLNASRINIDNVTLTAIGGSLFVKDEGIGTFKVKPAAVSSGGTGAAGSTIYFSVDVPSTVLAWVQSTEQLGNTNTTVDLDLSENYGSAQTLASAVLNPSQTSVGFGFANVAAGSHYVSMPSDPSGVTGSKFIFLVLKR